jgi:hypothetical protein
MVLPLLCGDICEHANLSCRLGRGNGVVQAPNRPIDRPIWTDVERLRMNFESFCRHLRRSLDSTGQLNFLCCKRRSDREGLRCKLSLCCMQAWPPFFGYRIVAKGMYNYPSPYKMEGMCLSLKPHPFSTSSTLSLRRLQLSSFHSGYAWNSIFFGGGDEFGVFGCRVAYFAASREFANRSHFVCWVNHRN